ncbi:MAG: DUF1819 family protein [Defluviitaleaceae bacterium]|nr:DUF1819 family protein [Defluviitaleaceae bacterium]
MSKELPYTSSIKDMPLMFLEMRRTALLLCEGMSPGEIIFMSMDKNIYQLEKEKRRRDVPLRMINRLLTISSPLVEILAKGSTDDAKLVALLALVKSDRLLFEYLYEVFLSKHEIGYDTISDRDFEEFTNRKAQDNNTIANWSSGNLKSLRGKIKGILCDAGIAKRAKEGLRIQRPLASANLLNLLDEEDSIYARAMLLTGV